LSSTTTTTTTTSSSSIIITIIIITIIIIIIIILHRHQHLLWVAEGVLPCRLPDGEEDDALGRVADRVPVGTIVVIIIVFIIVIIIIFITTTITIITLLLLIVATVIIIIVTTGGPYPSMNLKMTFIGSTHVCSSVLSICCFRYCTRGTGVSSS
jgi:hypothetical protein